MKRILLALTLACSTAFAADTKPSEASIKEFLTLTDAAKMVESIWAQVDGMTQSMLAQSTRGQEQENKKLAGADIRKLGNVMI